MFALTKILPALAAAAALSLTAGCAEQPKSSPQAAAPAMDDAPELAGAWYQIYFDTNKSDIDSRGRMVINTVAHVATNNGLTRVTVIGKTDRVGSTADNAALSQRRADQVRDALIAAGVPAGRIDTSWTGETRQAVTTINEAEEQRNRVVDVTVVKVMR